MLLCLVLPCFLCAACHAVPGCAVLPLCSSKHFVSSHAHLLSEAMRGCDALPCSAQLPHCCLCCAAMCCAVLQHCYFKCRHARVVALLDIFELDSCTFATVLELCEGGDLDLHLQRHQVSLLDVSPACMSIAYASYLDLVCHQGRLMLQ